MLRIIQRSQAKIEKIAKVSASNNAGTASDNAKPAVQSLANPLSSSGAFVPERTACCIKPGPVAQEPKDVVTVSYTHLTLPTICSV
eukprot:2573966-Rhodomonas_salina.2